MVARSLFRALAAPVLAVLALLPAAVAAQLAYEQDSGALPRGGANFMGWVRDYEKQVGAKYIGVQYDDETLTYRIRFIRDGVVFNVDVDSRTMQPRNRRKSY